MTWNISILRSAGKKDILGHRSYCFQVQMLQIGKPTMSKLLQKFVSKRRTSSANVPQRTLRMELLEDRRMLAVIPVTNIFDTSNLTGTLRNAILQANSPLFPGLDRITFDLDAAELAQGITSINGSYVITDALEIVGPSANNKIMIKAGLGATVGFDYSLTTGGSSTSILQNLDISGFDEDAVKISRVQSGGDLAPSPESIF